MPTGRHYLQSDMATISHCVISIVNSTPIRSVVIPLHPISLVSSLPSCDYQCFSHLNGSGHRPAQRRRQRNPGLNRDSDLLLRFNLQIELQLCIFCKCKVDVHLYMYLNYWSIYYFCIEIVYSIYK